MIDPTPCDDCGQLRDRHRLAQVVTLDLARREPAVWRELCPRCARAEHRRRHFGRIPKETTRATRRLLERTWREPLQLIFLQADDAKAAALVRRKAGQRRHQPETP